MSQTTLRQQLHALQVKKCNLHAQKDLDSMIQVLRTDVVMTPN